MKYQRLSKEQLNEMHKEFINFLASQTITAAEWEDIKKETPDVAEQELDVFSDLVWEGVLTQVDYLEHISPQQMHLFHMAENDMQVIAVQLKNEVDLKLAAASTLQGLTSQYLLHHSFKLKKENTLLMHAAAGGVGHILCQWAKIIGAKVIGTVGNIDKEKIAQENGCDYTINYLKEDFSEKVLEITKNKGF